MSFYLTSLFWHYTVFAQELIKRIDEDNWSRFFFMTFLLLMSKKQICGNLPQNLINCSTYQGKHFPNFMTIHRQTF